MEFLDDLKKINTISDDQFKKLLSHLNNNRFNTVKDITTFEKFCTKNKITIETGRSIRRILNYVFDYIIANQAFDESITYFEKDILDNYADDPEVKSSWTKIKDSINILKEFLTIRKEKQLLSRVPNLTSFSLTCEIRPIFDMDKTAIEELLFPIIMRIKSNDDERPKIIEIDIEDLHRIKKEVGLAIKKVDTIKERFKDCDQRT